MSHKESAGLLLFRRSDGRLEVLLAHPGGPFWAGRDDGAWTIPKGGIHPGEDPLQAAIREFIEETGFQPTGPFIPLGHITQRSGKVVHAWAFEGDCNPSCLTSVTTMTEWPPRSGQMIEIPENRPRRVLLGHRRAPRGQRGASRAARPSPRTPREDRPHPLGFRHWASGTRLRATDCELLTSGFRLRTCQVRPIRGGSSAAAPGRFPPGAALRA